MRGEVDDDRLAGGDAEFLLDLGEVAMFRDTVGTGVLVALGVEVLCGDIAAGSADARSYHCATSGCWRIAAQ